MVRTLWRLVLVVALVVASCGEEGSDGVGREEPPFGPGSVEVPAGATALSFSPDGRRFAFVSGGFTAPFRLAVVEDGRPRLVAEDMTVSSYAWMPDSDSFLVAHGPPGRDDLEVVDLHGKRLRRVPLDVELRIEEGMTVRADGKVAVVAAMAPGSLEDLVDLLEVDLETGRTRPLLPTPDVDALEPEFVGDRLAFVAAPRPKSEPKTVYAAVFDPATGRVERRSTEGYVVFDVFPSPDGRFLVYDGGDPARQDRSFWAVPIEGGAPVRLTVDEAGPGAIHPSGTRMVVVSGTMPYRLYQVPVELPRA